MSIASLKNILNIFHGRELSAAEHGQLVKEALLMTLSRATSADSNNVQTVEVETVQRIMKRVTGDEISAADVRVCAASELYEKAPLEKYLHSVGRKLEASDRMMIVDTLAEVIRSDDRISASETEYFDMVANALKSTPSELTGLTALIGAK